MITNPYTTARVRFILPMAPDRDHITHMVVKAAVREVVRALNTYAYTNA